MLRKLAKILGWSVGGAIAMVVIAYCVLLLINLEDQPPHPVIDKLTAAHPKAPPVDSPQNSYLFILGFPSAPETNPMAAGLDRLEWMLATSPTYRTDDDPVGDEYDFQSLRSAAVADLERVCWTSGAECLRKLTSEGDSLDEWLVEEAWLLNRYRSLVDMTMFRETIPMEIIAPLPSYGSVLQGQKLLLFDAWRSARTGDPHEAIKSLDADLNYWRMVLENSGALITKMIATSAIIQHFQFGNLVMRELHQQSMPLAVPESWRKEISDEERSMQRCLAGEWAFTNATLDLYLSEPEVSNRALYGINKPTILDRLAWAFLRPLWQPQDSRNRHARNILDLARVFDVPYEEMSSTFEAAEKMQQVADDSQWSPYNLAGQLLSPFSYSWFTQYAVRVTDLEGIRRATILAAELRAANVSKDNVAQHIFDSDIVDPYTNEAFTWHEESESIVFQGLEPNKRARREIIY